VVATVAATGDRTEVTDPGPPLPRDRFPVTRRYRYFNHAGTAPLSLDAADALRAYAAEAEAHGAARWRQRERRAEEVRLSAAALMGAPASDVAFVKNTSEGLGFVANGLDWHEGDRVLVPDLEFPSTLYPWLPLRERGVHVDLVEPVGPARALPLELFADELAGRPTRLVCVSWVQFGRGFRIDLAGLAELCRAHGALLCVDAIQGLGVLPCDLEAWGVDFAAADGHKWLLGPEGQGVLYVRSERRDLLRPLEPGWASVVHREEWDNLDLVWDPTARRFEGGTANFGGIHGLGASLDLLASAGVDAVWRHVDGLCDRLASGLAEAGTTVLSDRTRDGRSGIVTFQPRDEEPEAAVERLKEVGFVCAARGGGVRVSPHGYNTADEIDALIEAVSRISA
jgi:cysteine desulfurase / selenocysteine lyase